MNVTRFEPWNLINVLHRDLDRAASGGIRKYASGDAEKTLVDWIPAVDIVEEKTRYVMRAELPGVDLNDIDISMDKGVLNVSGQKPPLSIDDSDSLTLTERSHGAFRRRFTLPESADTDEISASFSNGVLEISMPKHAEVKTRRIAVEAA